MITSTKGLSRVQYPLTIENVSKLGIEENFFNSVKNMYKKSVDNIVNGEILEAFPLRMSVLTTPFQHYYGSP